MALSYELATYDPVTYLVGDEIVSGTPTFIHADTIYAIDYLGVWQSFGPNTRVVKGGRYVSDTEVYADDGSGTLLDPLPMTVYQPAATNLALYSQDVTNTWWTTGSDVTVTINAGNMEYVPTGIDANAETYDGDQITITTDVTYTTSVEVKAGSADWILFGINFADTDWNSNPLSGYYFNLATGEIGTHRFLNESGGDSGLDFMAPKMELLDNGFYLCSLTWQINSNAYNLHTRILEFKCADSDGDFKVTGDTSIFIYARQFQITATEYSVGPIYTTSSTDSTDEIINTYPAANWSDAEGPIYIEFDYTGEDQNILLNDDVPILYVASDILYLDDGINTTSIACSIIGEHKAGIALDASGGNMRLNLDAIWAD